jgi:hypothetical protein
VRRQAAQAGERLLERGGDADGGAVGKDRAERLVGDDQLQAMARQVGGERAMEGGAGEGIEIGRVEIVAEAGQRRLGRADGAAGLRLRLDNQDPPAGAREDDPRGEAVMPGADDDDVVAQGVIRPPLTWSTWPVT